MASVPSSMIAPSATTTIEKKLPRRWRARIASQTDSRSTGRSGTRITSAPPAIPECRAIQPAWRPMTSSTSTRLWLSAVVCRRSMASVQTCTAVSKPNVISVPPRSLSIVLGTPMTGSPCSPCSRLAAPTVSSPPMAIRPSTPRRSKVARITSGPSSRLNGLVRDERRILPPRGRIPRVESSVSSIASPSSGPRHPSRKPRISWPWCRVALRTMARMTAFRPGQSPPPVSTPNFIRHDHPMDFELNDDHRLIQRTVRDFAHNEVAPVAEELDRTKSFPYEIVRKLGELGLMGIPFPEEYGGGGGDTLAYALAVEELTRVDSSVAITLCAHTSLGTQPVYLFGSEEQKQEWMPQLCTGQKLGAFGLTEPEAGSDAGNTKTRAKLEDGEWVIDGAKQFITNAGTDISGMVVITAVTGENEISNLLVPNGTPGYEQGTPYRKMGWNASDTRPLTFTDCRVPEDHLVGPRGAGFKQFLRVLDIGRIGVAAMGVGLAQGALDQALAYAKERKAFGRPIAKFQAIQAKLADMATEIEAARLLTYKAARLKDERRPFTLTAAQAKLKTGRLAVRCAEEAVQIHGGYGYIEEYPVCRFYRDAKILTIGEGTDEVQQMVIARALGA